MSYSALPSTPVKRQVKRRHPLWWRAALRINRLSMVYGVCLLIVGLLIGRLFWLQVIASPELKLKAQRSRNHSLVHHNRGRILDRHGTVLAQDNVLYDLYAHPRYYRHCSAETLAKALAPILNVPSGQLYTKLSDPSPTITLAKNLNKDTREAIDALRVQVPKIDKKTKRPLLDANGQPKLDTLALSGLDFVKKRVRNYPQGQLAAHVLGYVNDEADLAYGVEETAKVDLKKSPDGQTATILDGKGNAVRPEDVDPASVVNTPETEDVVLTLDSQLQYICEKALIEGVAKTKASRGTAIMINPTSGEILAYAVSPSYSPETYFNYPLSVFKNWTLTDVYPPGSTIKILTVAMVLDNKTVTPDVRIHDTGKMQLGGYTISNYDYGKHGAPGNISLEYLLMHSSNVGSAKLAMMMPPEKHRAYMQLLGFGQPTGVDLPGESKGILLDLAEWTKPTQGNIGYGYSVASTPLQMVAAVGTLANQGVWITPHVMKNNRKVITRRVFSPVTSRQMTDILVRSIQENKESTVKLDGVPIAGKTGTSRKPEANGGYSNELFTSFIGYYPANQPKALVMVVVDNPKMAESWGSTVAGPIFKQIADASLPILGIKRQLDVSASPDVASQ
jgi:cell division protein FtsI (penicillin-binding protein 3)